MTHFRDADARDAALISHIHCATWVKAFRGLIPQDYLDRLPDDHWVPSIRSWLESGRFSCLLIYEDKQPVGCCIYGRGRDESHGDWGEIVSLYVLPAASRKGYGRALMQEAMARMREDGYVRFYLWAFEASAADGFYRREGFMPTADRDGTPLGGVRVYERRYVKVVI